MKKSTSILFALIFSITTLTSCSSDNETVAPTAIGSVSVESAKNYTHDSSEIELLDLINTYRVEHNLNTLSIIEHISYKSSEHNAYMIAVNAVSHDGFTERKTNFQQLLGAVRVGENVAFGFSSPQAALNGWIASDGHRANLEGDYTHFGVSIRIDANGKKYYTNMFIKK
jgi:uncharacterized protein YkwD